MASPQPPQERPPKIYLRSNVYSTSIPDAPYASPYEQAPVPYKTGDTIVYSRQPSSVQAHPYSAPEAPYYVDESSLRNGTISELSNDSKSRHSKSSQRTNLHRHHHHHRMPRIEDPDGYWKVPHAVNSSERLHSSLPVSYVTPGGRQLSKTPKKHTAGVQVLGSEQSIPEKTNHLVPYCDLTQEADDYMQSSQYLHSDDSAMTVSFSSNNLIAALMEFCSSDDFNCAFFYFSLQLQDGDDTHLLLYVKLERIKLLYIFMMVMLMVHAIQPDGN